MSEKAKFHNMTKPVKFRGLKMFKQYVVLWCKALRERINYLFNYILYKLHILKRYSYRDNTEQVLPLSHIIKTRGVETKFFRGHVVMKAIKETFYDIDYFYRQKKDGSKKITLQLKDTEESRLFLESNLENICLRIEDRWYKPNDLPVLKVAVMNKVVAFDPSAPLEPVKYDTVSYDLFPIKTLRWRRYLGMCEIYEIYDVSEHVLHYYYDCACSEFLKKLESMTLNDLIRR